MSFQILEVFSLEFPPHSFPAAFQRLVVHFIWISMINRPQRLQALIKELLLVEVKRTSQGFYETSAAQIKDGVLGE